MHMTLQCECAALWLSIEDFHSCKGTQATVDFNKHLFHLSSSLADMGKHCTRGIVLGEKTLITY